ncbi:MAG: hypothetical protein ACYC5Y_10970 [Symbiobacteriia bacterium]
MLLIEKLLDRLRQELGGRVSIFWQCGDEIAVTTGKVIQVGSDFVEVQGLTPTLEETGHPGSPHGDAIATSLSTLVSAQRLSAVIEGVVEGRKALVPGTKMKVQSAKIGAAVEPDIQNETIEETIELEEDAPVDSHYISRHPQTRQRQRAVKRPGRRLRQEAASLRTARLKRAKPLKLRLRLASQKPPARPQHSVPLDPVRPVRPARPLQKTSPPARAARERTRMGRVRVDGTALLLGMAAVPEPVKAARSQPKAKAAASARAMAAAKIAARASQMHRRAPTQNHSENRPAIEPSRRISARATRILAVPGGAILQRPTNIVRAARG